MVGERRSGLDSNPFLVSLSDYFLRPLRLITTYDRTHLRPDLVAGLTVAVILLPQAIAFALIAELPPAMGLYAAVVGAVFGALWGSSNQAHTGPTNAISLLVLSALITTAAPGTPEFLLAAGLMALMAGVFQLAMGLARLGMLVNFVSHSVIVGFAGGAAVLIALNQLRHLLGLEFTSRNVLHTVEATLAGLAQVHQPTAVLGIGTILLILLLRRLDRRLPAALISMAVASLVVFLFRLHETGVRVIGELPRSLPPLADLPYFDLEMIGALSTGALAVGAIGLVETTAISRAISAHTGQRLDSNQEFVGQGLANIFSGLFSGYVVAGSFSRSAVNYEAGARTPIAAIFSSAFVVVAMLLLAPLAAFLPRAALAGVLIVTAYNMIDQREIVRIWQGTRSDAVIMLATFLGTLLLHIEFAVLAGILLSFAFYIMKTSVPRVHAVLPDDDFVHFRHQPQKPECPQLGIVDILGDLYFGAVNHVEEAIYAHAQAYPDQRFLLLRLHSVHHCDISGIHMLESVRHLYRERGGDLYLARVREPVLRLLKSCGFYDELGPDHLLSGDDAVSHLFHRILDPAVCIYECPVRAFKECQNLPKREYDLDVHLHTEFPVAPLPAIPARGLWQQLRNGQSPPLLIDVREPREFHRGHIPQAELVPLPELLADTADLPQGRRIVLVCRSGRRSQRAAHLLLSRGFSDVSILEGGMLAWEAAGLLEAVEGSGD
jgi:sulfate permease, SulP family